MSLAPFISFAKRLFAEVGFATLDVTLLEADAMQFRLRHSCGSRVNAEVHAEEIMVGVDFGRGITSVLLDRAGCYCVPREVIVPCTFQRCEASP